MKNTLILIAEQMVANYAKNALSFLQDYLQDCPAEDFSKTMSTYAKNLSNMTSADSKVAFQAIRNELWGGSTMMMLSDEEFKQIESWYESKEEFRAAIFREDGSPVGLLQLEDMSW